MTIHIGNTDGSAKCGCNVYWNHYGKGPGGESIKLQTPEKRIRLQFLTFANESKGLAANCRKCTGTVQKRYTTAAIEKDMLGIVFHRSFGYDMTINEYCKAIKQDKKSLIVQECHASMSGDPWAPGGNGKASAGEIDPKGKTFRMFRKVAVTGGYEYWTGDGHSWSIDDGGSHYENRCD